MATILTLSNLSTAEAIATAKKYIFEDGNDYVRVNILRASAQRLPKWTVTIENA